MPPVLLLLQVLLSNPGVSGRGVGQIKDAADASSVSAGVSTTQVYGLRASHPVGLSTHNGYASQLRSSIRASPKDTTDSLTVVRQAVEIVQSGYIFSLPPSLRTQSQTVSSGIDSWRLSAKPIR